MISKENILSYLIDIKPMLEEQFHVSKIGLFGSFVRNEQTESSDIDLIIEFAPNTENLAEHKEAIKQLVSAQFHRRVDLAREKYLKPSICYLCLTKTGQTCSPYSTPAIKSLDLLKT